MLQQRSRRKETAPDRLSLVFKALADPTRRRILERLAEGPATVGELGSPFPVSGAAISQHLNVLEQAGLVDRTARAQWRYVSLRPQSLDELTGWVARQRREWDERLDRLSARASEIERR